ncbi:bacillithiol biosynthesis deacetylase BshB1 [Bacillus xiapuensis]|uniref:bacillithiol biosynthesis deacetylase BshB1 n=1 Tax=Bacillus xiapuensis TaxID=2014075 RepID=UPI000C243613|nr:bacillithiol biosynthesis deacetylase BshB1 [Bacillus xiapuensis]
MGSEIDILAFGAHADDIEIGMGGTAAKYSAAGKKIVFCDLTEAELSSNGTVELRKQEAKQAAAVLGVQERVNLGLADRGLFVTEEAIRKAAGVIRRFQPKIIFAPYEVDRHPDHGRCAQLVREAVFSAGIRKFQTDENLPAHKARTVYFYMINGFHSPDFCVDISSYMERKKQSLLAYRSQFERKDGSAETPLTNGYIEAVEARERMMGKEIGTLYAEGFKVMKPLLLEYDLIGD